ncbi:MAG: hypothetical protein RSA27_07750, partial [Oscillospiraceae bacterium]
YTPIVEDKGEKKGCVGIKADNWWANAYLGVEFTNAGNKLEALSGKVYLETDIMFDIPNYNDKDSTINFDLKSQNNNKMATIRSKGETL